MSSQRRRGLSPSSRQFSATLSAAQYPADARDSRSRRARLGAGDRGNVRRACESPASQGLRLKPAGGRGAAHPKRGGTECGRSRATNPAVQGPSPAACSLAGMKCLAFPAIPRPKPAGRPSSRRAARTDCQPSAGVGALSHAAVADAVASVNGRDFDPAHRRMTMDRRSRPGCTRGARDHGRFAAASPPGHRQRTEEGSHRHDLQHLKRRIGRKSPSPEGLFVCS